MLRLATERTHLNVVNDQLGAPTSAALLADLTAHVVRRLQTDGVQEFPFGVYHLAAGGETSWHDYACHVVAEAQAAGLALRLTPDNIQAIATDAYPTAARRPLNSRLDTSQFQATFGLRLPPWQQGLDHILQQIL
jgi:dTDP-4-dehydrorhamnose reductase